MGDLLRQPAVYILSNGYRGTLYTGVTSKLPARVWHHKNHCVRGFTERYELDRLVYAEAHDTMLAAITREKQLKKWHRAWKIQLIERTNPTWRDLADEYR